MWLDKLKLSLLWIGGLCWAALAPIHVLLGAVLGLVAIDFVTGIWKSRWPKDSALRVPVTSHAMRDSAAKVGPYFLMLLTGLLIDNALASGPVVDALFAKASALGIITWEVKSIAENLRVITGLDLLGALILKLKPPPKDPQ